MSQKTTMQAVLLTGHGGPEKLEIRHDWPVPKPARGEVLIKVGAAGVNNTDINTRIGWYSKSVTGDTASAAAGGTGTVVEDASWSGEALSFPRIQGADICGEVVATGADVDAGLAGRRVLVRTMQPQPTTDDGLTCITLGSELDGGFAEYAAIAADMVVPVDSDWSDIELASFPCAWTTAENMLERIALSGGEKVLITGASGGVGSAAIQLAKRRGAHVTAVSAREKHGFLKESGADRVVARDAGLSAEMSDTQVDAIVDLVAGPSWEQTLSCLKRGGRYVTAGAIAGPIVTLDMRTLYLNDWTLHGSTWQPMSILENLVGYIERCEVRPVVSRAYKLSEIQAAQEDFVAKRYPGKLVLVPDALWDGTAARFQTENT